MKRALFAFGMLIAISAGVLMLRRFFDIPPVGLEIELRELAMGFAFLGCGLARIAMVRSRVTIDG